MHACRLMRPAKSWWSSRWRRCSWRSRLPGWGWAHRWSRKLSGRSGTREGRPRRRCRRAVQQEGSASGWARAPGAPAAARRQPRPPDHRGMMQGKWPGAPGLSRQTGAACTRWQSSEQPLLQVSDGLILVIEMVRYSDRSPLRIR